jgi:hypothetical protein
MADVPSAKRGKVPVIPAGTMSLTFEEADENVLLGLASSVYLSMLFGLIFMIDIVPHSFLSKRTRSPSEF